MHNGDGDRVGLGGGDEMSLLFAVMLSPQPASAGWLYDLCSRWLLVADDPYQFENAPKEWLERRADRLRIKKAWGRASASDLAMLEIVERELELRERL